MYNSLIDILFLLKEFVSRKQLIIIQNDKFFEELKNYLTQFLFQLFGDNRKCIIKNKI